MRYRRIFISGPFITSLLVEGELPSVRIKNGLPKDSRFCYTYHDNKYGFWMVIEHESFDLLKEGDPIPVFPRIDIEKL